MGAPVIHFVHEGKAAYPEIRAYRRYFAADYTTFESSPDALRRAKDIAPHACWHMMGLYPVDLPGAAVTVHDYRSLSVGRFHTMKDWLKRVLNADPEIRIFQNQGIRQALGFDEDERTFYLPMGVPGDFIAQRRALSDSQCDFIYIGSMLAERKCELMLDSFLERFGGQRTFHLYGHPHSEELEARYAGRKNICFKGNVPQEQIPALLKGARVGVCYFPLHYPHLLQTPTKLLEYAALGMRIVANEHPQSRSAAAQYQISCEWGDTSDMFAQLPDELSWPDNSALDPSAMAWPSVIGASGVPDALRRAFARAGVTQGGPSAA